MLYVNLWFVLGRIHSHPGPHAARGLQVGHPCFKGLFLCSNIISLFFLPGVASMLPIPITCMWLNCFPEISHVPSDPQQETELTRRALCRWSAPLDKNQLRHLTGPAWPLSQSCKKCTLKPLCRDMPLSLRVWEDISPRESDLAHNTQFSVKKWLKKSDSFLCNHMSEVSGQKMSSI